MWQSRQQTPSAVQTHPLPNQTSQCLEVMKDTIKEGKRRAHSNQFSAPHASMRSLHFQTLVTGLCFMQAPRHRMAWLLPWQQQSTFWPFLGGEVVMQWLGSAGQSQNCFKSCKRLSILWCKGMLGFLHLCNNHGTSFHAEAVYLC